jgi:cytochrome c peroxidase
MKVLWPALMGPMLMFCCSAAAFAAPDAPVSWVIPRHPPVPADNVPNPDRIELGRLLFFDPRLSAKGTLSCASCHNPALGWTDGLQRAFGNDMKPLARATPTLVNVAFNKTHMWDGRKLSLEEQALGPLLSPDEQNLTGETLTARVSGIDGYAPLFERAYPGEPIGPATVAKAIASFERTLLSADSPFDRWQLGDAHAVSEPAKRGFALFTGKAQCTLCHQAPNFTDDGFHNIGLKGNGEGEDVGRYAHKKVAALKGAFKTPTLRDIDATAPYMHNGLYRTLEEVVDHYDRGGDVRSNLSANIRPLGLAPGEKADLVAFMKSLTGSLPQVPLPQLPR